MTRTVRDASVTEVDVETFTGFDGGGVPSYNAPQIIHARLLRQDRVRMQPDGTSIRTQYTLWVDAGEDVIPIWHDRLAFTTLGEEHTAVVEFHEESRDLRGVLDHVKLECREE